MTLTKKAETSELELAKVVEIAGALGIESDANKELSNTDAMKLGKAVTAFKKGGKMPEPVNSAGEDSKLFRIWTAGKSKTVFLSEELGSIKVRDHSLILDEKKDAEMISIIKRLKNVIGMYEVIDEPFEEDSDEYEKFEDKIRELVFTGLGQEASRGGVKAIRALLSHGELSAMGEKAFNPKTLVAKVMRSKSVVHIHNV